MVYKINFPGGATGSLTPQFSDTGHFAQQINVGFPTTAKQNLANDYVVRIASIQPDGVSGSFYTRVTYPEPSDANSSGETTSGGTNYAAGSIITSSTQFASQCAVRIYKNGSSTVYFKRESASSSTGVRRFNSSNVWQYNWGTEMSGFWEWHTVPAAPASITATKAGLRVTVTYTASTDDGGDAIDSYTIQRAEVNGGVVGTWVSHSNSDILTPSKTYRFRVYATNSAGNSQARTSTDILISAYAKRYGASSYSLVENYYRFNGSSWVPITTFKRFNGSTWEDMSPKT